MSRATAAAPCHGRIVQREVGQAAALSAGIAASSGDVVVTLDADDRLVPGILATVAMVISARIAAARSPMPLFQS